LDAETTPTMETGWAVAALCLFFILWIIPLYHALRSRRRSPVIEVLLLLGLALLPIAAGMFAAGPALIGAVFLGPMLGILGMLWFAALLVGLAAELGEALRRPRLRPPARVDDEQM